MSAIDKIKAKAKSKVMHIVLPEGTEPRTVQATRKITDQGIAKVTLLGNVNEVKKVAAETGTDLTGVEPGALRCCLPDFVIDNYRLALPQLGRRLRGFDWDEALLTGPETRSSSPLRILRNARRESPIGGVYPLGEGAGYAGGIVSAAVDGLCAGMTCDAQE